jgi:hypothetical protein
MRKVDDEVRAGGSAKAKHRPIVEPGLLTRDTSFAERARRHREALRGRGHSDGTELIMEDRDRDYDNGWPQASEHEHVRTGSGFPSVARNPKLYELTVCGRNQGGTPEASGPAKLI